MLGAKEIGFAGGAFALVVVAFLATSSIVDLIHDRNYWRAMAERPARTTPAPAQPGATQPAGPVAAPPASTSPAPSGSTSPTSTPQVVQAAARTSRQHSGTSPTPAPPSSPAPARPQPSPTPTPRCPSATVLTLRVPVGAVPCNAAVAGGSG